MKIDILDKRISKHRANLRSWLVVPPEDGKEPNWAQDNLITYREVARKALGDPYAHFRRVDFKWYLFVGGIRIRQFPDAVVRYYREVLENKLHNTVYG